MLFIFVQALVLGVAVNVPVGPASLSCMQRTLTLGRAAGLVTGIGIATADALNATLIAGGFSIAADFLAAQAGLLTLAAGILLVGLGIAILRARPGTQAIKHAGATHRRSFVTGFLVTFVNPMEILMMATVLAVFGLIEPDVGLVSVVLLIAGIFSGSLLWWAIHVSGVSTVQRQIPPSIVGWINRAAGAILVGLGIIALGRGLI